MKMICVIFGLMLAGCATGDRATGSGSGGGNHTSDAEGVRGISALIAEHPEKLRDVVVGLIGDGPEGESALEIIDRYEDDLRFVLGEPIPGGTIADPAMASGIPEYSGTQPGVVGGVMPPKIARPVGSHFADRIRRFTRNSLSVAMIGLNECYDNFKESGDDRFARRGLAHGYLALISEPSPTQKSQVIQKMKILQEPFIN